MTRRRQGRRVCSIAVLWWKTDPSRGGGPGTHAAGREGRVGPADSADGGPWQPATTGDDRPTASVACCRHGRDHTPRRWRTTRCSVGSSFGVAAGPRRRSAVRTSTGQPVQPWHNNGDRLGLSELGALEGPVLYTGPSPTLSPFPVCERPGARAPTSQTVRSGTAAEDGGGAPRREHPRRHCDGGASTSRVRGRGNRQVRRRPITSLAPRDSSTQGQNSPVQSRSQIVHGNVHGRWRQVPKRLRINGLAFSARFSPRTSRPSRCAEGHTAGDTANAEPVAFAFSDAAGFALIARRGTRTNRPTSAGAAQTIEHDTRTSGAGPRERGRFGPERVLR